MTTNKTQVLAVIGQGYVGLPLAVAAAEAGWSVIGIDSDEVKINHINSGSSPVEDIGDFRLQALLKSGLYRVTSDYSAVSDAAVITICVPTPLNENREPDLGLLQNAVRNIAPYVSDKTLVVSESTSYPGTLRNIVMPILNSLKSENCQVYFAAAPERVNPGDTFWNQKNTPRLVGSIDADSQSKALEFYGSICSSVEYVSSPEIAEAAKLFENTFRLVNIALVNQLAQICSAKGINVNEVIAAASSKPYGFMPFKPGIGAGGHCIPVDPLYLTWWARQAHFNFSIIETADKINQQMPEYVGSRALQLISPSLTRPKVLIIGVAYKQGVSDVRETPVAGLRNYLVARGVEVAWHDPLVERWEDTLPVNLGWSCDLIVLAVKQDGVNLEEIMSLDLPILDCTNTIAKSSNIFWL